MTENLTPGQLFVDPDAWTNMSQWHERVAHIRRTTPVLPLDVAGYENVWVLTRHSDVFNVSRDNIKWLNTPRAVLGPDADWQKTVASGMPLPASLVQLDGTKHQKHRLVASEWFKPAAVGSRQSRIDEIADQFIERMRELGTTCDFARDIVQPYTLRVIMDIYGVPHEDEALMMELTQGVFGAADPEFMGDVGDPGARLAVSIMRFIQYFAAVTEDRRACPRDDLATVIANGQIDGCPMGDVERLLFYIIVATAGHDTTSFALSGGLEVLLQNPAQLQALRDDPNLVVNATEEIIRWTSPVRHFLRLATEDMRIGDSIIPEGGRVLLSYPAANRDETTFVSPMNFDVRRTNADKNVSFGGGTHYCLGAQFARREVRTFLGRLLPQLATIEANGEASWSRAHFVSGVKHLPITYCFKN